MGFSDEGDEINPSSIGQYSTLEECINATLNRPEAPFVTGVQFGNNVSSYFGYLSDSKLCSIFVNCTDNCAIEKMTSEDLSCLNSGNIYYVF